MSGPGQRSYSVALTTLGCKLNQAETEDVARKFVNAGYRIVAADGSADVYVINTCTVTHIADRKSRQLVRHLRRLNPSAIVAATGCYAEVSPSEVQAIEHIDLVVNNQDKPRIVEIVSEALGDDLTARGTERVDHDFWCDSEGDGQKPASRTRAFVKIEDGCNKFCSFCIVPFARGRERSVLPKVVVESVAERVGEGHKEIVLTGVHIGTYGHDLGELSIKGLNGLIERILDETAIARFRLSSIEPMDFTPELLSIWANPRICRHLHLPLQSGSDTVLQRMRRRYTRKDFAEIVAEVRASIPEVAITTDVIVGFPGESDAEFQESYDFARELGFAAIHVFRYSARHGTLAARMPNQVAAEAKKARSEAMLRLSEQSATDFAAGFIGGSLDTLYETRIDENGDHCDGTSHWEGITDNYLRVRTMSQSDLGNAIRPTKITGFAGKQLVGSLIEG